MRAYIYALINLLPSILKSAATALCDRIFAVWDDTFAVFSVVANKWLPLNWGINSLANSIKRAIGQAYNYCRWLVTVKIPHAIASAVSDALDYVLSMIDWVNRQVASLIQDVRDWFNGLISDLSQWAHDAYDWTVDRLREIINTLNQVAYRVWQLLTDPEKFAEWAIGAIWSAFWRYFRSHLVAIAEATWQERTQIGIQGLGIVEYILARIL